MKRAIIYARVSDRKQVEEGVSMEAQIEMCTRRAEQLGASVVRVFRDDGVSGRSRQGRHGFEAAISFCEMSGVDFLVTWSTSRFARNMLDLWVQTDRLDAAGTRVECLNADIDDDTDAGFINKVFHGAMDQMLSRQISRDTLRSMKKSASDGYFTGGRVPFGYEAVADGKRTRLVPHPAEAAVVKRCFALCLQGLGTQAIMARLNDAGELRRGERWKKSTLAYMLNNEIYTGVRTFNRWHRRTGREKPRTEWIQVTSHEALVSREDFERAQAIMDDRAPHQLPGGTPRSTFAFSGLLTCGVCGGMLQIVNGTGRGGALYSYYGCCAHKRGSPRCLFRNVRADLFDAWLIDQILATVLTREAMQQAVAEMTDLSGRWAQERREQRAQLVRELKDLEARRNRLYDVLELSGRDAPDLGDLKDRLQLRNAEIRAVQARLDKLEEGPLQQLARKVDVDLAVEVMGEVVRDGDTKKKRAFMGALLESITVTVDRVTLAYRPEALANLGHSERVRSGEYWLPDLDSNQGPAD